jgi:integrase
VRERHKPSGTVYLACIKVPDPLTGKERETSKQFKTRRDADRHAAEMSAELRAGTLVARSPKTVADLLRYWDETYVAHQVRPNTAASYRHTLYYHLIPALGRVKVQDITPAQIEQFYAAKLAQGTGTRTLVLCHLRLSQAFKVAVRLDWVGRSPLDRVTPPRDQAARRGIWSREELGAFLLSAEESGYGPVWLLMALTGMRRGEALGLRWSDVDPERGVLVVSQAYVSTDGQMVLSDPKGAGSRRAIPLHPVLTAALRRHQARQEERRQQAGVVWSDNDLVFASRVGTPIIAANMHREHYKIVARARVSRLNIHGIRHTVASHLLAGGEDIKTVSDLLGHAKTSTTLNIYSHVVEGRKREAIDTLGSLVLGGPHEPDTIQE